METPLKDGKISELTQGMVKGSSDPEFVGRKLLTLRSREDADVKFLFRAAKKGMGHWLTVRSGPGCEGVMFLCKGSTLLRGIEVKGEVWL